MQYSVFSSILTLGATISGVISGRTTDLMGPRGVGFMTLQSPLGLHEVIVQCQKAYQPFGSC